MKQIDGFSEENGSNLFEYAGHKCIECKRHCILPNESFVSWYAFIVQRSDEDEWLHFHKTSNITSKIHEFLFSTAKIHVSNQNKNENKTIIGVSIGGRDLTQHDL